MRESILAFPKFGVSVPQREKGPYTLVNDAIIYRKLHKLSSYGLGYIEPLLYKLDSGYGTMEVRFISDSSYNQTGFRMLVHFTD